VKYPKIEKLPSGNYRMQIQIDGQRYSITDGSTTKVRQRAKELLGTAQDKRTFMTVEQAYEDYIKRKTPYLSPSTILGYRICKDNYLRQIMDRPIDKLTQDEIQSAFSYDIERGISRKTLANARGLLTAVLHKYRPNFKPDIDLPPREYNEICIPTEDELKRIWCEMADPKYNSELSLVILMASWLGLRISEILALRFSDFDGDHVNIHAAKVRGVNGSVIKGTKSYAGYRRIKVGQDLLNIIDALPRENDDELIIKRHRSTINRQFHNLCENIGLPAYRIHDLRHFSASEALALNIPNKYQMKRMGHSTEYMLQNVYQHVMRDKEDYFADLLDNRMSALYSQALNAHENPPKSEKTVELQ